MVRFVSRDSDESEKEPGEHLFGSEFDTAQFGELTEEIKESEVTPDGRRGPIWPGDVIEAKGYKLIVLAVSCPSILDEGLVGNEGQPDEEVDTVAICKTEHGVRAFDYDGLRKSIEKSDVEWYCGDDDASPACRE